MIKQASRRTREKENGFSNSYQTRLTQTRLKPVYCLSAVVCNVIFWSFSFCFRSLILLGWLLFWLRSTFNQWKTIFSHVISHIPLILLFAKLSSFIRLREFSAWISQRSFSDHGNTSNNTGVSIRWQCVVTANLLWPKPHGYMRPLYVAIHFYYEFTLGKFKR